MAMKRYELTAEIYTYVPGEQDPDTGSFPQETWDYENPRIVRATGGSVRTWQSIEKFLRPDQGLYVNASWIQLFMPYRPSLLSLLGNVRNKAGEIIYAENDGSPTDFEVNGVFPQIDMNGKTIDYQVACVRRQIQR
ncbi:hypothetical protein [Streptomyces parvulus]|uniref:hypothetical protein n=1 Tax=Streptomyces parvulus TaxID=146923 RepID=UPI0036856183